MRKRKMSSLVIIFTIFLALTFPPMTASADIKLAIAKIEKLGVNIYATAPIMVQLIDVEGQFWTAGTLRQFYLDESLGNAGYATLLTAYTQGKTVWVRISGDGSNGSLITTIYINDIDA